MISFIQKYKLKRTSCDEISYYFESIIFAPQKLIDRKSLITDKPFKKINLFFQKSLSTLMMGFHKGLLRHIVFAPHWILDGWMAGVPNPLAISPSPLSNGGLLLLV